MKRPAVYILANYKNGTLYTGVTSNLIKRIYEHKENITIGFTSRYAVKKLVYFEIFDEMYEAITFEKKIKAGSRKNKIALIEKNNAEWRDLYEELTGKG